MFSISGTQLVDFSVAQMEALRTQINPADFSSEGMARDNEQTEQDCVEETGTITMD